MPLINSLKKTIAGEGAGHQKMYGELINSFESIPELLQPIEDLSLLQKHSVLIEMLLSTAFPLAGSEADYFYAVAIPFSFDTIYASRLFQHSFMRPGTKEINVPEGSIAKQLYSERILNAFYLVLNRYSDFNTPAGTRSVYPIDDSVTGLKKYFEVQVDARFVEVKTVDDKAPQIPADAVSKRTNRMMDVSELYKLLPLDQFIFEGLVIVRICDVTSHEVISEIKNTLLNTNAFYDAAVYETLQSHIQTLLGLKEVKTGITPFFKMSGHFVYSELHNSNSLLFRHFTKLQQVDKVNECCRQLFYDAGSAIVFETLSKKELEEFDYLDLYYEAGARSLILCPLKNNGELIGVLEIISQKEGSLNHRHIAKIQDAIPLFTLALEKSAESIDTQIDKVIKQKFTVVQPAVEWKFTEVAWNYIQKSRFAEEAELEKISFKDVYPLYAAVDIRNSSAERSDAIQLDLIEQLNIVANIITKAKKQIKFQFLEEIEFKINKFIQSISDVLLSDEEITIHDFLHGQVSAMLNHLRETLPEIKKEIDEYFSLIDPHTGVIHHHRRKYEESITKINETVSSFIDKAQQAVQDIYPHYFERYVTDGVEFNIYIGQSIAPHQKFNEIYLSNLKMWQLTILAKTARLTIALESKLPTLLSTTQLILANSIPISISFRAAERKFDVDGAYNIRYEIIKKRIDKVRIKETNERLTQPGKIAIVYTQPKEATEYMEYIEFLQNLNLLKPGVEQLELEELQGVIGLKALRVDVELDESIKAEPKVELSSTTTSDLLKTSQS